MLKRNHRALSALAVALVLVLTLSAPAMAMTSTMTYRSDGGEFKDANGLTYTYGCTTGASLTRGTASMTYGRGSATISCTINATVVYGSYSTTNNSGDAGNSSISASVNNNISAGNGYGDIVSVIARYLIYSNTVAVRQIT